MYFDKRQRENLRYHITADVDACSVLQKCYWKVMNKAEEKERSRRLPDLSLFASWHTLHSHQWDSTRWEEKKRPEK